MAEQDTIVEEIEDLDVDDVELETDDPVTDPSDDTLDEAELAVAATAADDDPPKKKGGVQKRIDELTKRARKAEKDAEYYRGLADGKATTHATGTEGEVKTTVTGLKREHFESEEDYIDAVVDQKLQAKSGESDVKKQVADIQASYDKGRKKYEDFDAVVLGPTSPITKEVFDASAGENLGDILYYLNKNPGEVAKLTAMSPVQMTREIGKIEVKIMKPKETTPKPPKKVSDAPDPIPAIPSGNVATVPEGRQERFDKWEKERIEKAKLGASA